MSSLFVSFSRVPELLVEVGGASVWRLGAMEVEGFPRNKWRETPL